MIINLKHNYLPKSKDMASPRFKLSNILILTTFVQLVIISVSACKKKDIDTPPSVPITLSCNDINTTTVWADRGDGIDYILPCEISVNSKLTIEPGVVIQCNSASGISIETAGSLVAVGTVAKPIQLKGEADIAGVWKGIYIKSSSAINEISYCTISNGGASSFDGNATKLADIRLSLSSKLKLTNSTISKSGKDGLLTDGLDTDTESPVTQFIANTFTGNANYPVSSIAAMANVLDGTGSTYTGNTYNKVLLRGGNLFGSHTWKKLNVPYLIESVASVGYYSSNGNLTIQPGVVVHFAGDAGLCIGDYATGSWMNITGTASERITLTGESAIPGAWKGLSYKSTSLNNVISYADISYGGSSSYSGSVAHRGNIIAGSAGQAGSFTISNSTINYSETYGIYATAASPALTIPGSVTYTGNLFGTYYHE
jgi:hypothetical protein